MENSILLFLAVLVTTGIWFRFLYKFDRVEPEPLKEVIKIGLIGGFLSTFIAGVLNTQFASAVGFSLEGKGNSFFPTLLFSSYVGINEELFKFLPAYFLINKSKEVDEPIDPLIYATAIGLGFAMIENIQYTFQHGLLNLGFRTITAIPLHIGTACLWGKGISDSIFLKKGKNYIFKPLVYAILIHAGYDLINFSISIPYISLLISVLIAFALIKSITKDMVYLRNQSPFIPPGYCATCGTQNDSDSRVCMECGADIAQIYYKVCLQCNSKSPSDAKICPGCGYNFQQKSGES